MPLVRRLNKSTGILGSTGADDCDGNKEATHALIIGQLQRDLHHKEIVIQELMRQVERLAATASSSLPASPQCSTAANSTASPTSTKDSSPRGSLDGKGGGEGRVAWRRRTLSCIDALAGEQRRSRLGSFIAKLGSPSKKSAAESLAGAAEPGSAEQCVQPPAFPEWSYYELTNNMAEGVDPDHLERHLNEDDCIEYLGICKDWLGQLRAGELEVLKERARISARHHRLRQTLQHPTASSPTAVNKIGLSSQAKADE